MKRREFCKAGVLAGAVASFPAKELLAWIRDLMTRIHASMFGVSEVDLPSVYFRYMAQYQVGIFIFNLAPYIALKLIA